MRSRLNPRVIWLFPALLLSTTPFVHKSDIVLLLLGVLASVAILVPLVVTKYRMMTFTSTYCVMNLVFFPGALLANLLLPEPAMNPYLWLNVDKALLGITSGMGAFSLGHVFVRRWKRGSDDRRAGRLYLPHAGWNTLLASATILIVAIKFSLGVYYHSSILTGGEEASGFLNLIENLSWIAYLGIFLQVYRFTVTRARSDGVLALVLILLPIALYLPSAGREQTIGFLPLLCWVFLAWERRAAYRAMVAVGVGVFLITVIAAVGIYRRDDNVAGAGIDEQYQILATTLTSGQVNPTKLVVSRLSDCLAAGQIIATTPTPFPYRNLEGVGTWWQIYLPGFLRPETDRIDMSEGATTTTTYGINTSPFSSSPVTTIGDLYSRHGYLGIIGGMLLIGAAFSLADSIVQGRNNLRNIVFFVLFTRITWRLYAAPFMVNFIAFGREILVVLVLTALVVGVLKPVARRLPDTAP